MKAAAPPRIQPAAATDHQCPGRNGRRRKKAGKPNNKVAPSENGYAMMNERAIEASLCVPSSGQIADRVAAGTIEATTKPAVAATASFIPDSLAAALPNDASHLIPPEHIVGHILEVLPGQCGRLPPVCAFTIRVRYSVRNHPGDIPRRKKAAGMSNVRDDRCTRIPVLGQIGRDRTHDGKHQSQGISNVLDLQRSKFRRQASTPLGC